MRIATGSDHAGYEMKKEVDAYLREKGHEVKDFGSRSGDSCDYPDFAHPVAREVAGGKFALGILLCGSANGICMAANRHTGVRAAIAWNREISELARSHNDANILCLPSRYIEWAKAREILDAFLETTFEGGRHERRINKIEPSNQFSA